MPSGSKSPMISTRVVSLKRLMKMPTMPGIEIFSAWGRMMSRIAPQYLRPRESAASYWPLGIACRPPRITSAMKAEANSVTMINTRSSRSNWVPGGRK